jgi:hypothetical protein
LVLITLEPVHNVAAQAVVPLSTGAVAYSASTAAPEGGTPLPVPVVVVVVGVVVGVGVGVGVGSSRYRNAPPPIEETIIENNTTSINIITTLSIYYVILYTIL